MEGSSQQPDFSDNHEKSRSLDLHSIYNETSGYSAGKLTAKKLAFAVINNTEVLKRKRRSTFGSGVSVPGQSSRKRIGTESSLSSSNPSSKRRRQNNSNAPRLKLHELASGVGKVQKQEKDSTAFRSSNSLNENSQSLGNGGGSLPSNKQDHQALTFRISENTNGFGDSLVIPKGPRGTARRKKIDVSSSLRRSSGNLTSSGKSAANGHPSKLPISTVQPVAFDGEQQVQDSKQNGASVRDGSVPRITDERTSAVLSSKKIRSRKRKSSTTAKQVPVEKEQKLGTGVENITRDLLEDDEENLEQTAARMLSSRFDPSCTGFSGNRIVSSPECTDDSSPLQQVNGAFRGSHSEISSAYAADRVLRPRKRNSKGFVRKRRHFYEVCSKDIDPQSLVKQRIRVLWPLDQCWYFGLVKDYDPATKLHHVKYDDRDEEWINLRNERFKLLLFPSEVCRISNTAKFSLELKQRSKRRKKETIDGNCIGNFMESEPIISWLARSSGALKSSPSRIFRKQRAHLLKDLGPSSLSEPKPDLVPKPSATTLTKTSSNVNVPENLVDGKITEVHSLNSSITSHGRKILFVYTRKRFRKRKEALEATATQVSACVSEARPRNFLGSLADGLPSLEDCLTATSLKQKQVSLRLALPIHRDHGLASAIGSFWLCHDYFLHRHAKLILLWPMVHMEIIFVDNVLGLRIISVEGCLKWVMDLVSSTISTFYQCNKHDKLADVPLPFTSIGFNISGLYNERRLVVFVLHSFFQLEKSKWEDLELKLKHQYTKLVELPSTSCVNSNLNNFPGRSSEILCAAVMNHPTSCEDLLKKACSDVMYQLIPDKSTYADTYPGFSYFHEKYGSLPPCAFSFDESPSCLGLHLKLLVERNIVSISCEKHALMPVEEFGENDKKSNDGGCSPVDDSSDQVSETTLEHLGSSMAASSSGCLDDGHPKIETDALSVSSDGDWMRPSQKFLSNEGNITRDSTGRMDIRKHKCGAKVAHSPRLSSHGKTWMANKKYCSSPENASPIDKYENGCDSFSNATGLQSHLDDQVNEQTSKKGVQDAHLTSDLSWKMNVHAVNTPKATAPRSIWHQNRHNLHSPTFSHNSRLWPEDSSWNGFSAGPRKSWSQVPNSLPLGMREIGSKPRSHNRKARPYKKISVDCEKWIPSSLRNFHSYLDALTCDANVLVTAGDKGWRECGAQVVLESDDQKVWRISVKFAGAAKFVHEVHQSLQPGTTNRFTHAMMWKGGKDWILEFIDRGQWSLFKELHEECYNRNIRAASVKHIPTPGVRLVEDAYESSSEVPFVRSSPKYFRQVGTEVDMALDPSRVVYDMDSGDEEWLSKLRFSSDMTERETSDVSDDMFETAMDTFEKFAYAHQCDKFTSDEIEEFMADAGPLHIVKAIHEYWRQKRQKKGLPLIRQFQPPLWECYQQQLKEWELAASRIHNSSDGCQDKGSQIEKPPMFAFCLRPRGLEVPNKGSKQRSHKKFVYTGHHSSFIREQDFHASDKKMNGALVGEEKALVVSVPGYESSDSFHSRNASSNFLSRDSPRMGYITANYAAERSQFPVLYRSNSRKKGVLVSPRDPHMMPVSHSQKVKKNIVTRSGADISEWATGKKSQFDGFRRNENDIDEFRLRDASNVARHASKMAKLKRERAQWLLHKADLALHKATVALNIAEAMKASEEEVIDEDG